MLFNAPPNVNNVNTRPRVPHVPGPCPTLWTTDSPSGDFIYLCLGIAGGHLRHLKYRGNPEVGKLFHPT